MNGVQKRCCQNLIGKKINVAASLTTTTREPTGFRVPEDVIVTYNSATRKVTLTGTVEPYYELLRFSEISTGYVSPAHADVAGTYFLVYDGTSISWKTPSAVKFYDLLIAYAIYQAGYKFAIRECHGFQPWQSHEEDHDAIGTYRKSGGDLGDYTLSSTTAADRRPSVSATQVKDEDLPTLNPLLADNGPYTQFTLSAADTANLDTTPLDIVPLSTNRPYFNELSGGTWGQTLIDNNQRMSVWLVGVPVTADSDSQKYRYFWVQGQNQSNLSNQRSLTPNDVDLGDFDPLAPEFIFFKQVIIRYQSSNWFIEEVINLTGTRVSQATGGGGGLTAVTVLPPIAGNGQVSDPLKILQVYDDHTAEAHTLIASNAGQTVRMINGASAYALTFPPTAGIFETGDMGRAWKTGSGEITGTKGASVSFVTALVVSDSNFKFDGVSPYLVEWEVTDTNEYTIRGNIAP